MTVIDIYLPFGCHILLFLLYMWMCREEVITSKSGGILNIKTIGFLVSIKVGVLRPVQQPGSYWDRSSELPLVGLEPTEVTAYD